MKRLFLIVAGLSLTACTQMMPLGSMLNSTKSTLASASQPGTANIPVIIVAGQSNAVGQGQNGTSAPVTGMEWRGLDYNRGIGPAFAEEYLRQTHRPQVIVIQCAIGGTNISQWIPGGALDAQCQAYYQKVLIEFPTAKVATVLWWQGEGDTAVPGTPWAAEFSTIVRAWQGLYGNVPIEFCQLANTPIYPYWSYIQAQQASVNVPFTIMVKTADLNAISNDGIHMTAEGLLVVGQRLAQGYFGLLN